MGITLSEGVVDLDQNAAGANAQGASYDLGDGRVLYAFAPQGEAEARGFFSIHDLSTGAVLAAPRQIDPDTAIAPGATFDMPVTDVFAAQALAGGGVRLFYTQAGASVNFGATQAQAYSRDYAADGTPVGASQALPATQFFLSNNTVHLELEDGGIALAHDRGLTVLDADGSVRGGDTGVLSFFTTDQGYAVVETGGQILVISTRPGAFPGSSAPIQGQFYGLDGAPQGAPIEIVPDPVQPPTTSYSTGEQRLDAARLVNGDIVLVYADNFAEGGAGENSQGGITGLVLAADGTPKGDPFLVNPSETEGRQTWPKVQAQDDGGFVVVYDDDSNVENRSVFLRVQQFDAAGTPLGEAAFVRQTSLSDPILIEGSNAVIGADGLGLVIDFFGRARTVEVTAEPPQPAGPITGTPGNDPLPGTDGDDEILGLAGNDTLDGGAGADRMDGGRGDDLYYVDNAADRIVEIQGGGSDTVLATGEVTLGSAEIERVELLGTANLRVNGNQFATEIQGNAGSNILLGGGGGDSIAGGGGADFFAFLSGDAAGPARIADFTRGQDRLAIDDQLFGLGDAGIDPRDVTDQQVANALQFRAFNYNSRTGELFVDADGSGGPADPILIAVIEGGGAIGVDDVLLF